MRLKYVLRRLIHSPGFTLVTTLTLALGIGANSAIFTVIEGTLLKPLPYPHAERLVAINHTAPGINFPEAGSAPFLYFTYREEGRVFEQSGLWQLDAVTVTGLAEPEQVPSVNVTADLLPALGISPSIGRRFSQKDDSPGAPQTAILMNGYWKARFGGDPGVIGRRMIVDGHATEIIGVMPESFRFLTQTVSMLIPLQIDRAKTRLGNFSYRGIGRLKPGATLEEASTDVARMIPMGLEKFPAFPGFDKKMFENARLGPKLKPLKDDVIGDIGKTLWVLMGTIGVVLLIACANVANLLLVRAEGREQELAIRAALGAGWTQIARELLGESVALGLLGGGLGLALASAALQALVAMAPANLPRLQEISIDPVVLVFTLALSLLAGLLFGIIPVVKYAGPRLSASIRAGGRTLSASRERRSARNVLAVVQVALALVLLIGSGLMIRTFQALRRVDPGFTTPAELQTLSISIPESQAPDGAAVMRMEQNILDKISAIPGVASAGMTNVIPMTNNGWTDGVWAQDRPDLETRIPVLRRYKFLSPGFLRTMGTPLLLGREFTWTDTFERRPVAMLSENLAREFWGDPARAIGKRIPEGPQSPWREVIGIVGDEREDGVDRPAPQTAYWPLLMNDFEGTKDEVRRTVAFAIRSPRTGSRGFIDEVQRAVWAVNPNLPLAAVRTLQEIYGKSMARTSFTLVMLAIAGHGAVDRPGGDLRRDLVLGFAAPPGNRDSPGAGCAGRRAPAYVRGARAHPRSDRRGLRRDRGAGLDAPHLVSAIPRERGRPGYILAGFSGSARRGIAGQLPPGPSCNAGRSSGSIARGVVGMKPLANARGSERRRFAAQP
jgi:putative ABC transport system permease protein